MRKAFRILLAAALLAVLAAGLLPGALADVAGLVGKNEETGFEAVIDDPAGLLGQGESGRVLEAMRPVTAYANAAFVTYEAGGSDTASAVKKAEKWGESRFGRGSDYTVFIIDMKTRRLGIYSSKSVYGLLSTAKANTITDNVYKYASRGEYADCAAEAFSQITKVMQGNKISQPMKYVSNVFIALICAILVTYMLVAGRMRHEQATSVQTLTQAAGAGIATAVTGHVLKKVVHHERSSGGGGGFRGGGGGFSGGGGGGGGGSHGF